MQSKLDVLTTGDIQIVHCQIVKPSLTFIVVFWKLVLTETEYQVQLFEMQELLRMRCCWKSRNILKRVRDRSLVTWIFPPICLTNFSGFFVTSLADFTSSGMNISRNVPMRVVFCKWYFQNIMRNPQFCFTDEAKCYSESRQQSFIDTIRPRYFNE